MGLFFPDNQKRYDRVVQLQNDIGTIRGHALGQIDSQKDAKTRLDKNCKELMALKNFKTLEDLQKHVLSILPEDQQKKYLANINTLKNLDENLDTALMYNGLFIATAGGLSLAFDRQARLIEMASELEPRVAWNSGFFDFWHGRPIEGWKQMSNARAVMRQNLVATAEAGEVGTTMSRWKFWRGAGAVMETIAKWAFLAEILLLVVQYKVAETQREELRKAIHDFFYGRFGMIEQSLNIDATVDLLKGFGNYFITENALIVAKTDDKTKNNVLTAIANKLIDEHSPLVEAITDEKILEQCAQYDTRRGGEAAIYTADDPSKDPKDIRKWLEDQQKAQDAADKNTTEQAQKIATALEMTNKTSGQTNINIGVH